MGRFSFVGVTDRGSATQGTSKATAVTINAEAGLITTHGAELAGAAEVAFVVNNNKVEVGDVVIVNVRGGATATGQYIPYIAAMAAGSFTVGLANVGATASDTLTLNFVIIHGAPHSLS